LRSKPVSSTPTTEKEAQSEITSKKIRIYPENEALWFASLNLYRRAYNLTIEFMRKGRKPSSEFRTQICDWCKNHMASGTIRTQDFWANSAIFQTSILAYNLMVWMMWLNTKTHFHEEPNTIRAWLIQVPAKLISRARQLLLTLDQDYVFKERWLEIEDSISALNFA
jgi:hypothetical protein